MVPGSDPDPGVVQSFLDDVAAHSHVSDHLVEPLSGSVRYPVVVSSRTFEGGQWAVESAGCTLSLATYDVLRTATAQPNGSLAAASGTHYTLRNVRGVATLIQV